MAGLLWTAVYGVSLYTVFAPIVFLDGKHLKRGLLLLLLISVIAFVLHLLKMV